MENELNFDMFETPSVSEQKIRQKQSEKAEKIAKNNKKNLTIKIISTICAVLITIVAVLCIYFFTAPSHNPEKLVIKYINEINNAKWEKSYSCLYLDNTPINKDAYINFCQENAGEMAFTPSKIIDFEINKDAETNDSPKNKMIPYSVDYVLEDGNHGTFYLSAMKINEQNGKLAKYSIIPSQKCFASLKITVPALTEIEVNGIKFSEYITENGNSIYNIRYAFTGTNNIRITNPYCSDIEEVIEIKPGDNVFDFTPEITEKCYNELCEKTKEYITSIYTDVITDNKDFTKYQMSDSYKENGFNNDIEKIKADVFMGNYEISDFKVEEASLAKSFADIDKTLHSNSPNELEIRYNFTYSYTATYNDENGKPVSTTKSNSGYFTIKYVLENEWHINDISTSAWF